MPFYHLLLMEPECLPKASTVTQGRMLGVWGVLFESWASVRWTGATSSPPSRLLFSQSYL